MHWGSSTFLGFNPLYLIVRDSKVVPWLCMRNAWPTQPMRGEHGSANERGVWECMTNAWSSRPMRGEHGSANERGVWECMTNAWSSRPMRGEHAQPMRGVHEILSLPLLHCCWFIQITPLLLIGFSLGD